MGLIRAVIAAGVVATLSLGVAHTASAASSTEHLRAAVTRIQAGEGTSSDEKLVRRHPAVAAATIDPRAAEWDVRSVAVAPPRTLRAGFAKTRCKTVTVSLRQRTLLGFTAYIWHHEATFCYTSKKVTSWGKRFDYVTKKDGLFFVRELMVNKHGAVKKSKSWSHLQRNIENCLPKVGCIQSFTPWSKITVNKKGAWSWTGKSS